MIGYHFSGDKLRNGEPIPRVGDWLEHRGPVEPCVSGLHASEHPLDALRYAPGPMLHKVELEGDLQTHGDPVDKHVGRRRKILASIDAAELLYAFARWCALQVIDLWDAPDIVQRYLETGDKSLRSAAWSAAESAAESAWRSAAESAAWSAAWSAAESAWSAAESAWRSAAWSAAWSAAESAWSAAESAWRKQFAEMVDKAFQEQCNE